MARKVYGSLDLSDNQLLNALVQQLPSDPTGVESKIFYDSALKLLKYHNGSGWVIVSAPTGVAGGDLSGTYPNPSIAAGVIVDADVNASANIAQTKISGLTTSLGGKVDTTRTITAGAGLTGGGDLSANRTLDIGAGTGITVAADAISINTAVVVDLTSTQSITGQKTFTAPLATADPSVPLGLATKQYVDIASQGFTFKNAVRVVATTNTALSGLLTIDGVTLVANDRVLVANNTTPAQNGIYLAQSGAWTRATDMDANGELVDGTLVPVGSGTANADSQWICTATGAVPWVVGTSTSTWTKFASLADLTAGAGLTKTGNQIDVIGDATLTVAADQISVASAPKWSTGRTIALTGDVTGTSAAFDGSGNLSFATVGVQAAKWTTPRSFTLTGDVTGSVATVDGSANVTIATTLAAGAGGKRYAAALTSSTSQVVTHGLGTQDVVVSVYNSASPYEEPIVEIEHTSATQVTIKANPALPAGYRVVVLG